MRPIAPPATRSSPRADRRHQGTNLELVLSRPSAARRRIVTVGNSAAKAGRGPRNTSAGAPTDEHVLSRFEVAAWMQGARCGAGRSTVRFIDDEQYYRWLRVSLTFSIILLLLTAPGMSIQEMEFAGIKFGIAGTHLLRLLVMGGAAYSVLQYLVTSWMASRRAALFAPQDGVGVVGSARLTIDAARERVARLRTFETEIERLPMLAQAGAVTIELGGLSFLGDEVQPAFSELRHRIAERARAAAAEAGDRAHGGFDDGQLDQIAEAAAAIVIQDLDVRFAKRLHGFETRQNDSVYQVAQLHGNFRDHVDATGRNLDLAASRLVRLHRTLIRLDIGRDAKFVVLELLPTTALFVASAYHYVALSNPRWTTLFDYIAP